MYRAYLEASTTKLVQVASPALKERQQAQLEDSIAVCINQFTKINNVQINISTYFV